MGLRAKIFDKFKKEICNLFSSDNEKLNIIEFGAGDALETKILLNECSKHKTTSYYPIDFSKKYLDDMEKDFAENMPNIKIKTINKDYFEALKLIDENDKSKKVILFIGSSLGGLTNSEFNDFFNKLSNLMNKNDILFLGMDLKKNPDILHKAYHNTCKNWCTYLLQRVNNELNANFNLNEFEYYTTYNPENGKFKWYFISNQKQTINIKPIIKTINI